MAHVQNNRLRPQLPPDLGEGIRGGIGDEGDVIHGWRDGGRPRARARRAARDTQRVVYSGQVIMAAFWISTRGGTSEYDRTAKSAKVLSKKRRSPKRICGAHSTTGGCPAASICWMACQSFSTIGRASCGSIISPRSLGLLLTPLS